MRYDILFIFLGAAAIMFGMAAKNLINYAPLIGWLLGFAFFLVASVVVSFKARRQK
jgi:membrane protein implicated in regulation of membrane protease activity